VDSGTQELNTLLQKKKEKKKFMIHILHFLRQGLRIFKKEGE